MAIFGLNNALIPIVAFNMGCKKTERVKKAIFLSGLYSALIGLIGTAVLQLCPAAIMNAFNPSDSMLEMGVTALRILSLAFVFGGITVMISYALQGFSRGISSLIISASRQVLVLLPVAWILGKKTGINGIWWSFLIAESVVMIAALFFIKKVEKKEYGFQ